jgi:hypothetical protein
VEEWWDRVQWHSEHAPEKEWTPEELAMKAQVKEKARLRNRSYEQKVMEKIASRKK